MRCEDFPCCGHAGDPGGCPDYDNPRKCKDCGQKFYPDAMSYDYCYRCQAVPKYTPSKQVPVTVDVECAECLNERDKARRRHPEIEPGEAWDVKKAVTKFTYNNVPLCADCAEDIECENRHGWEMDIAEGRYDE